ncbi:glycosyltransferase family 2 protein [Pseudomonas putida]|nr:glycosyltransferase family 2 protein [Pseudomonas putida]EKT4515529.1 glycosyltransferase family 2 protein [Pseudomonas putida]
MRSCIIAIAKDEGCYLYEWAAYHLSLGFDKIFLYDNDSSDNPREALKGLESHVEIIEWPTIDGISPQLSAYNNPALHIRDSFDFAAYIDIDEFITLRRHSSIKDYLKCIPDTVSAIAINQKIFGSSHLKSHEDLPVTYRFKMCARSEHPENLWFKTLYRTKAIKQINSCHKGSILFGDYTDASFNPSNIDESSSGQTKLNCSDAIHINHYILKSQEEFETKKKRRGGGMSGTKEGRIERYNNDYFFTHRDSYANSTTDTRIIELIQKIENVRGFPIYPRDLE